VRTVSGLRGQIKKAQRTPEGAFRATFEDRLLMSDIVFLRCWYPVQPRHYYNPITDKLTAGEWRGMKTLYELRKERSAKAPFSADSQYSPIVRKARVFAPLQIPSTLAKELPFASVPKLDKKRVRPSLETRRAVVLDREEKKRLQILQQLGTIKNDRLRKQKEKQQAKLAIHLKQRKRDEERRSNVAKGNRKKLYRLEGLMKLDAEEGKGRRKGSKRRRLNQHD
jgi:ribosome biogenesis protein BMS1